MPWEPTTRDLALLSVGREETEERDFGHIAQFANGGIFFLATFNEALASMTRQMCAGIFQSIATNEET